MSTQAQGISEVPKHHYSRAQSSTIQSSYNIGKILLIFMWSLEYFVLNISFPCTDALSSIKNSYQRYVSLSPFCFLLQGFPYKKCLRLFYLPEEKRVIFRSYVSAKYSLKTGDLHRTFTATHFHVPEHHWNRTWKKWEGSVSQEINAMCSTYFQYYTWHFWL